MEFLAHLEYWYWLFLGSVFIILEVFVPSAIFLWPGIAGLVVGIVVYLIPELAWPYQILVWAVFSLALAFGWHFYRKRHPAIKPISSMNRRGEQYVGRHFTLTKDIINGVGELHVDDTRWKILSSKDLPTGIKVRVTAVDGTSLRVEEHLV